MRTEAAALSTDGSEIEPLLYSVKTTCRVTGKSPATIWRLIADGTLESVMIGASRMVKVRSVRQLAEHGTRG